MGGDTSRYRWLFHQKYIDFLGLKNPKQSCVFCSVALALMEAEGSLIDSEETSCIIFNKHIIHIYICINNISCGLFHVTLCYFGAGQISSAYPGDR